MATLQSQTRIGGYELTRLLGEGGMGEVWLAQDRMADRPVALKFIKPHLLADPGFRTRFSNEAKTLGKLEHDRIVTLYTVLDEGDHLALVLRFIDGKSLADRIDTRGALPLSFVMSCARDILPALQFAHDNGIIHRDIKPENILVDNRDRCFLMDFGIAVAAFAERGTVTGFAIGTPHYMSPEQIRMPRQITPELGGHRSDIYSFGVVLYEMLSGKVPFGAQSGIEDIYAIQHAHCNEMPSPLRDINPNVPEAIDTIVLNCLAKDPDQRPQTCTDLLAELESAAQGAMPVRRAYAPTVVEPRPSAVASPAAPTPPAVPVTRPQRKLPPQAWYAAGAIFVAGGIGYTVWNSNSTKPAPIAEKPPIQAAPIASKPRPQPQAQTQRPPAPVSLARTATQAPPPQGGNTIVVVQPSPNQPNPPQQSLTGQPQGPSPQQIRAQREFEAGKRLFKDGDYCGSKARFDNAVSLDPNPIFLNYQRNAADGCNVQ